MQYNATVEVAHRGKIEDAAERLVTALEGYSPATGRSLLGRLDVTITVPAESLRQAATTALAVVEAAAGRPAVSVQVLPTDDFDRLNGLEPMPELLSVTEAAGVLGVSRQRVLQLVEAGTLPAQKVGNAVVLFRAAVEARAAG
jgi:excisionase family DNA binding protein